MFAVGVSALDALVFNVGSDVWMINVVLAIGTYSPLTLT